VNGFLFPVATHDDRRKNTISRYQNTEIKSQGPCARRQDRSALVSAALIGRAVYGLSPSRQGIEYLKGGHDTTVSATYQWQTYLAA